MYERTIRMGFMINLGPNMQVSGYYNYSINQQIMQMNVTLVKATKDRHIKAKISS